MSVSNLNCLPQIARFKTTFKMQMISIRFANAICIIIAQIDIQFCGMVVQIENNESLRIRLVARTGKSLDDHLSINK